MRRLVLWRSHLQFYPFEFQGWEVVFFEEDCIEKRFPDSKNRGSKSTKKWLAEVLLVS
jgi:hypothetical protein